MAFVLPTIALVLIFFAYRLGVSHSRRAYVQSTQELMASHEEHVEALQQANLLHSNHAALILNMFEQHIESTDRQLDPDHSEILDIMRPYYEMATIH
jgi:hypothetical protein